jgi:hypothetical protein
MPLNTKTSQTTYSHKAIALEETAWIKINCHKIFPMWKALLYVNNEINLSISQRHWKSCLSLSLKKVKVKDSRNRPSVAQRVPGGLGSQISMTFGAQRGWGHHPHAPAAFIPRKCSWYSFSLGDESTPGWRHVTEKSSDTTGNWSQNHLTSSAAP